MKKILFLFSIVIFLGCSENKCIEDKIDSISSEYYTENINQNVEKKLKDLKNSLKILRKKGYIKEYKVYKKYNPDLQTWAWFRLNNGIIFSIVNIEKDTKYYNIAHSQVTYRPYDPKLKENIIRNAGNEAVIDLDEIIKIIIKNNYRK